MACGTRWTRVSAAADSQPRDVRPVCDARAGAARVVRGTGTRGAASTRQSDRCHGCPQCRRPRSLSWVNRRMRRKRDGNTPVLQVSQVSPTDVLVAGQPPPDATQARRQHAKPDRCHRCPRRRRPRYLSRFNRRRMRRTASQTARTTGRVIRAVTPPLSMPRIPPSGPSK